MSKGKLSKKQLLSGSKNSSTVDPASGAVLVFTEQPSTGIEFGVDCITYETGPKFRGLSVIPPGLHFIYYGTGMGARQGYFLRTTAAQVIVHSWDAANEQILPSNSLSPESLTSLHLALNRGSLNSELGPYPYDQYNSWKRNSCYINDAVLLQAECSCETLLYPGDESAIFNDEKLLNPTKFADKDYSSINKSDIHVAGEIATTACFLSLKQAEAQLVEQVPRGDPQQRANLVTQMMMDKTHLLLHLLSSHFKGSDLNLLGELQLSFMLFMLLYSYPALQHWKSLVYVICSSESYLHSHPAFASAFMKCFYYQLEFAPVDFFESELSKDNFLRPIIVTLFHSLDSKRVDGDESPSTPPAKVDYSSDSDSDVSEVKDEEAENENDPQLTVDEHKKRLFNFLRKKFNLFDSMQSVLAAPLPQRGFDPTGGESAAASVRRNRDSAIDSFTLMEEDQPAYVSQKEIHQLEQYGRSGDASTRGETAEVNLKTLTSSGVYDMSNLGTNPCDARWAATDEQLTYLRRAFGMNDSDYVSNVIPLSEMEISDAPAASPSVSDSEKTPKVSVEPMTALQLEIAQFNWRYPLIFGNLQRSSVTNEYCEDFTMAAMRILEEEGGDLEGGSSSSPLVLEAIKFVEEEVSRMQS